MCQIDPAAEGKPPGCKGGAGRQAVVDKGLNSYASTRILTPDAPVIEPKYFIWVIQKADGSIMDHRDQEYYVPAASEFSVMRFLVLTTEFVTGKALPNGEATVR